MLRKETDASGCFFLAWIAVRNELSEFDNMEAVQFREKKQACQNPAVCLIELFVTFENQQGGSLQGHSEKILSKKEDNALCLIQYLFIIQELGV